MLGFSGFYAIDVDAGFIMWYIRYEVNAVFRKDKVL